MATAWSLIQVMPGSVATVWGFSGFMNSCVIAEAASSSPGNSEDMQPAVLVNIIFAGIE